MSPIKESGGLIEYLKSREFLKQILLIVGSVILLLFMVNLWLRFYTNHGQKLQLPKFIGMNLDKALDQSESQDFDLIVSDSVFVVGKSGGIITDQNPKPGSFVKEGRKVYVTVTKYGIETIKLSELPLQCTGTLLIRNVLN
ncbi:MAG: PASTA domain-containing protein [Saprospiraceae bacterium]|nr:PASTA domain-containing protein [Saprospiraceae bacterium]